MNEISIFGSKCRIEIIIICLLFGFIAGGYMLCGCIRPMDKRYEGMEGLSTPQNYNNDGGNMYSWVKQVNDKDMRNEKDLEIELNTLDNNKISKSLRFKTN